MSDHFCLYGAQHGSIDFAALLELQRETHELFARAENSGSEGTYAEVARWNHSARQWQRYAFLNCFGTDTENSMEEATRYVDQINALQHNCGFIHTLPQYIESTELLDFSKEMVGYLQMKLDGYRRSYPSHHAVVLTCESYLQRAKDLLAAQRHHGQ